MRTPSLRRRAVLWSVAALAVVLLVVGVGVDLVLGSTMRAEQRARLQALGALSTQLSGVDDQMLANRLTLPGVQVTVTATDGSRVVGVPGGPPGRGPRPSAAPTADAALVPVTARDGVLTVTERTRDGSTVVLRADDEGVRGVLSRLRVAMTLGGIAAIVIAAGLLWFVLGRALAPLDALTGAARATAQGDRGRRLAPRDPRTDLGRAAVQFDAMLEELEGAERAAEASRDRLQAFLSDASHELRTPVAGMSAGAERLLLDRLPPAEHDRVAAEVVREGRRAARLVDDLLLVSRLGELRLATERRPLVPLLDAAAHRSSALRGAPTVEVVGSERLGDAQVDVDPLRLDQLLANLLRNAAQAGAGRVRIVASLETASAVMRVSDDGPGIPRASRAAVFERLMRLDPARTAATGGAGLGLPIARGLAEAHGGSLRAVEGAAGDLPGAVLELRLPRAGAGDLPAPLVPRADASMVPARR